MNQILTNTIIIGLVLSSLFSLLGNIILWKKYSYFSDGLTHSCLLGILLHYIFKIDLLVGVYSASLIFAISVQILSTYHNKNLTTLIIAQGFLALSIILSGIFRDYVNITDFFLGDILLTNRKDLMILSGLCLLCVGWFACFHKAVLIMCISPDIARSYNIRINLIEISFLILLATVIAVTIKILGSLLVSALLIIPATIASLISRNPYSMLINSWIISSIVYYSGLFIAIKYDLSPSPLIVFLSFILFTIIKLFKSNIKAI